MEYPFVYALGVTQYIIMYWGRTGMGTRVYICSCGVVKYCGKPECHTEKKTTNVPNLDVLGII